MFTVLLVDDEPTMLESVKASIQWQQLGVRAVFTAPDGQQAIEVLKENTINLIISDIRMPYMDGISLLKYVRSNYPDTHIILVSAHSEFEYARQAIALGAENFLLKPVQKEELVESIERALDNIYSNRNASQQLFRSNIFIRWVKGTIAENELADRAAMLKINLYLPEYQVFILQKNRRDLSLSSYCLACVKQLEGTLDIYHFKDDSECHIFIVGGRFLADSPVISNLTEIALRMGLSNMFTISVGSIVSSSSSLSQSFYAAQNLLESVTPQDSNIDSIPVLREGQDVEPNKELVVQQLNILLHDEDDDSFPDRCYSFVENLILTTSQKGISYAQSLLVRSIRNLFHQEFPKLPDVQEQIANRARLIKDSPDWDSLRAEAVDLLNHAHFLYRYYTNLFSPIVQSAIQYIHAHYSESISIQEFCNIKKVSAPYLGHLFKLETGSFFNTYLTQYRISNSIPLLLDFDLKINDIAARVGFSSTNYYITCFRKQTGLSPIKYRTQAFTATGANIP